MADDEQPRPDQRGLPPAVPGTPPIVPGEAYDADQWRRFQQFQEFQRFEEAQRSAEPPPPGRPRPGKRRWRRLVFNRWVRRLVVLLVLLLAASWAVDHYFGNPDENLPASMTGGGKATRTVLFGESPRETLRLFYKDVSQSELPPGAGPDEVEAARISQAHACGRFETAEVEQLFADHFNAPTCEVAVQRLAEQVTDASAFARPVPPSADLAPRADGSVVVSSCAIGVTGGPPLGEFTLRVIPGSRSDQWTISDHRKEPVDCR